MTNHEDNKVNQNFKLIFPFIEDENEIRLDVSSNEKKWIEFDYPENLLPQKFIDYYRHSPTFSSIINKKAEYTSGTKVIFNDEKLKEFCKKLDYGNGLHSLIKKISFDYWLFNGFCIQMIWKPYVNNISSFHHTDFAKVRRGFSNNKNDDGLFEQGVWISKDWRREVTGDRYTDAKFHNIFDFNKHNKEPVYDYWSNYTVGSDWYPLPKWFSASTAIETEIATLEYDWNSVNNGFMTDGMLRLPSSMKDQNIQAVKKELEKSKGARGKGNFMVAIADSEDSLEWIQFNNTPDDDATGNKLEQARQSIITGCGLPSPTIVGLPNTGGLSSTGETIKIGLEEFKKDLEYAQNIIIGKIKEYLEFAGFENPDFEIESNFPSLNATQEEIKETE